MVWRAEEELAMEQVIKGSRITRLAVWKITIEIRRQPRGALCNAQWVERVARRAQLARQVAEEREAVLTRFTLHL
jgi:hypothetical protein